MALQSPALPDSSAVFNEIRSIQSQINHLLDIRKKGIVEGVDVVIQELKKKEFKLREQQVLKIHKNAITKVTVKKLR